MLCTNVKRERVRETSGSNANNKICFEVRAPSSTSPPSPRRISNPLSCPPRTPTERTSTEEDFYNKGVPNSSLKQPPHNRGVSQQPTPLPKRVYNQTPPLTRGSKPQASTSTKEGATKKSRVYKRWSLSTTNLFSFSFSTKTRS